jgi:hypothetical protein
VSLKVAENKLESVGDAIGCVSLEELTLTGNPIRSLREMHAFPKLTSLTLDSAGLENDVLRTLQPLTALRELSVAHNMLTEASVGLIASKMTRLVSLDLSHNRIQLTDAAREDLSPDIGPEWSVHPLVRVCEPLRVLRWLTELRVAKNPVAPSWATGAEDMSRSDLFDAHPWLEDLSTVLPRLSCLDDVVWESQEEGRGGPVTKSVEEVLSEMQSADADIGHTLEAHMASVVQKRAPENYALHPPRPMEDLLTIGHKEMDFRRELSRYRQRMQEDLRKHREHLHEVLGEEEVAVDDTRDGRLGFAVERTGGHVKVPGVPPRPVTAPSPAKPSSGLLSLLEQDTDSEAVISSLRQRAQQAVEAAMRALDAPSNRYMDVASTVSQAQEASSQPPPAVVLPPEKKSSRPRQRPASARLASALEFARGEDSTEEVLGIHEEPKRPVAIHKEPKRPVAIHEEPKRPVAIHEEPKRPVAIHEEPKRPVAIH